MNDNIMVLKAIADETRLEILRLLLSRNYCVGALAQKIELSEAAISQHLKVLREAGLVNCEKCGYYSHYDVDRERLCLLAKEICRLAEIKREACEGDREERTGGRRVICRSSSKCEKHSGNRRKCKGAGAEKSGGSL